jgi:hypothetical protein
MFFKLNVGGTLFQTTEQTINKCKKLKDLCEKFKHKNVVMIDRDPKVFCRFLKFLRGYLIDRIDQDQDLICELIFWEHYFLDTSLCTEKCIDSCARKYHEIKDKVNVTFPSNVEQLNREYFLIPKNAMLKIFGENFEEMFKKFYVFCTQNWVDHYWVEHEVWNYKINEAKLKKALYKTNYCIC